MKFTKMHGAGNDFIIINNFIEHIPEENIPALARKLCERRLSIGADGLMLTDAPKNGGDYRMLFFNSDGSAGEMCGNGARCICRYGYENGLAGNIQRVETASGLVTGERISGRECRVRLNDPTLIKLNCGAKTGGEEYDCSYLEMGTPGLPHAIVRCDGWDTEDRDSLRELGRALRWLPDWPKGANVTFWKLLGPDHVKAVTFERGVEDFTLACGTGAGCTAAALTLNGVVSGTDVRLDFPGGTLCITLTVENGGVKDVFLTGPTNIVCTGTVTDEDL